MNRRKSERNISLVVIGGSAGSIPVLRKILSGIKPGLRIPIIVCLHRMKSVSEGIQEVLSVNAHIKVMEPEDKEELLEGRIYVAPSNYHLLIENRRTLSLSTEEMVNYSRPSIDITFSTASIAFRQELMGILLTGANKDGAAGLEMVKLNGGLTAVQDPDECIAPYMPRAAIERKCVDLVLPVDDIIKLINRTSLTRPPATCF